eukprot:2747299-Pyramimonas_sp.AAC.1
MVSGMASGLMSVLALGLALGSPSSFHSHCSSTPPPPHFSATSVALHTCPISSRSVYWPDQRFSS